MPKRVRRSGRSAEHAAPSFQFYPADFLGGSVAEMTLEERGAYVTLLCHAWQHGSIPADTAKLARILSVSLDDAGRLYGALRSNWCPAASSRSLDGASSRRLVNPRMERERARLAEYLSQRAEAAAFGGKARARSGYRDPAGRWTSPPADVQPDIQPADQPESSPLSLRGDTFVSPPPAGPLGGRARRPAQPPAAATQPPPRRCTHPDTRHVWLDEPTRCPTHGTPTAGLRSTWCAACGSQTAGSTPYRRPCLACATQPHAVSNGTKENPP